ncbi:MAG: DUF4350 domain-containing protein [Flectobacillus sp.]|uniref:DUF4350 domain-containing protein n=1 Tax=Flectobacillus sp. TaxID=50419 RepID=UPI003B9B9AEE
MAQKTKYIIVLIVTFLGFIAIEIFKPKPTVWVPTYSNADDIPYGGQILYRILPELFPNQKIHDEKFPVLAKHTNQNTDFRQTTYISIANSFTLDSISLNKLLTFVDNGNTVFIAAEDFGSLADTLHFSIDYESVLKKGSSISINFTNPQIKQKKPFRFRMDDAEAFFEDSISTQTQWTILARNNTQKATYIKIKWGNGTFFLNSTPKAFSNYYVISPSNSHFAINALRYLPQQTIYWDEYYQAASFGSGYRTMSKSIQKAGEASYDESPFRYIISQPALRWAYYLTLIGLGLFMIFEAKRRQRIIPIIQTPANTSVVFVKTIGQLYFNKKEHLIIARKKITHLLHFIRDRFYLNTNLIDDDFLEELSHKSGIEVASLQAIFKMIQHINTTDHISEKELILFNNKIEEFHQAVKQ